MRDHIERLRAKPEHIRKRIAIGTSVGITAVVAIVWVATLATSGTLALNLNSPSDTGSDGATVQSAVTQTKSNFDQLLGAVGFAGATTSDPTLQVEDVPATTSLQDNDQDQTVIPF